MFNQFKGKKAWILPSIWATIILILTSIPTIPNELFLFDLADKVYHVLAYAPLGFFLMKAFHENTFGSWPPFQNTFFFGSIFGLADEVHQYFIPGRFFDLYDWLADSTGILIGCVAFILLGGLIFGEKKVK